MNPGDMGIDNETVHETESESPDIAGPATPAPAAPEEEKEKISAFVPMEFFGGKTPKEGEIETVRVASIDPESGEVELVCEYKDKGEEKSMVDMLDEAMPE